jgi:hypothetical protein
VTLVDSAVSREEVEVVLVLRVPDAAPTCAGEYYKISVLEKSSDGVDVPIGSGW